MSVFITRLSVYIGYMVQWLYGTFTGLYVDCSIMLSCLCYFDIHIVYIMYMYVVLTCNVILFMLLSRCY